MTRLSAEALTFAFDHDQVVFRELSLKLHRGEVLVLLGANGAGKTTLLKTLAGQLRADAGQVLLDEVPMQHWSRREIAQRLALMPQSELRETALSVRDVVRLGRAAHRGWWMAFTAEDEQKVDQALQAADITDLADRAVTKLSGGQWRRVVLARALAQDAAVLLLDEPTAGLDLKHQYECLEQIRRLVKQNDLIAVISLHDLGQTAMFADRIALMADQQIVAIGDCQTVLTPERIEQAYGIEVTVIPHPVHGRPLIVPLGPNPIDQETGR
ncbi:ABC transporter ATP-binding protein [Roseimaritima ulvae]|uniref:Putative siderophore transport system ATP-binding protein YusV n=1 Tax=Roseimaritima ulvae TaxID=980254 RepID=A0A5B9QW18_9BACT|nr:ABC transporter ATP-binding protein [Roseimaritima ulvae]QEG38211.1 putative siderophore transport system ATP-binding protein YusV [Roseimaritima ulvae]